MRPRLIGEAPTSLCRALTNRRRSANECPPLGSALLPPLGSPSCCFAEPPRSMFAQTVRLFRSGMMTWRVPPIRRRDPRSFQLPPNPAQARTGRLTSTRPGRRARMERSQAARFFPCRLHLPLAHACRRRRAVCVGWINRKALEDRGRGQTPAFPQRTTTSIRPQ